MTRSFVLIAVAVSSCAPIARGGEEIPAHRLREIVAAAPEKPRVAPKKARRVLIFVTPAHLMPKDPHKGYCIPYGTAAFRALGTKSGAYEPVVSDDLAELLPDRIGRFDAIVLNNTSGAWITPTDTNMALRAFCRLGNARHEVEDALRKAFLGYVRGGGGLVVVHYAVAGNRHWPEFRTLVGGTFIGHPWNEEIGVIVEEPDHPLTAAFGGKDFRVADEIYEYGPPYDRSAVRVLLSLDPGRTNMGVRWIHRKDRDWALAWVKAYGRGRVFNTSFGHRAAIYADPRVLRFYLDAIQWAAGDLDAPSEPRAGRPTRPEPGTDPAPGLEGFVSLFNGRDLAGWSGDPNIWSVQDGAITGRTTPDVRVQENTFLVWKDEVENFELHAKFRLEGGNSGIYYRSRKRRPGQKGEALVGPQADFSADGRWTGEIMEFTLRGELARCGQDVTIDEKGARTVKPLGDPEKLLAKIDLRRWNAYHVVARGGKVTLRINGTVLSRLDDRDPKRPQRGWLGVQVHRGPPMRVQFKDLYLRRL